jgi:hypothetical protein
MRDVSAAPAHKLRAAVSCISPDVADKLSPEYRAACKKWFDGLSGRERVVAVKAVDLYKAGSGAAAEYLAADLPPAPIALSSVE